MLNTIKEALRINNNAYDNEITNLINACKKELELVGIAPSKINNGSDPMITQAIILYCKSNFGYDNPDAERFQKAYENTKIFLALNKEYKNDSEVIDEPVVESSESEEVLEGIEE